MKRLQLTLVVQQLFSRLGRVLGIRALDDGVHGAGFLAEAAVDALGHVDVVAGGSAGAVGSLLGLNGDGLGGADLMDVSNGRSAIWDEGSAYGFAELAGDAALFARGVSSEGVLAAESGGDGALGRD